jgi:ZIP family zinc transporter
MGPVALGFVGSLLAGLLTAAGALSVLFGPTISRRTNDVLLGFAAGVMLAASFFFLIVPGLEAARVTVGYFS